MDASQNINLARPRLDRAQTDSAAPGKRRQLANLYHGQDRHGNDRDHHTRHHIQEATSSLARTATFLKSTRASDDVQRTSKEYETVPPSQSKPVPQTPPPVESGRKFGQADIRLEEQKAARRQDELRETLNSLSDLANGSTRRLDTTYYSILEKISSLRSTIGSLQELSMASARLRHDFELQTSEIVNQVNEQISDYHAFEEQQSRVTEFEQRIRSSVERSTLLNQRLEAARGRAEAWSKREIEWQARTSKRLKWSWIIAVGVLSLVLLWAFVRYPRSGRHRSSNTEKGLKDLLNRSIPNLVLTDLQSIVSETLAGLTKATSEAKKMMNDRLNVLDEL